MLHTKSLQLFSENKLVFRFSNQQKQLSLVDKNDVRNPKLFHLFYLIFHDAFEWQNNENNNIHTICISFAVAQS